MRLDHRSQITDHGSQVVDSDTEGTTDDRLPTTATTPNEQAISSDLNTVSLPQIQRAASLPATQQTDEQTLTAAALPSGDGNEIPSQLDPFTPDMRAAGISEARGPPAGTGE